MERNEGQAMEKSQRPRGDDSPLLTSSRRRALDRLQAAVEHGEPGPILVTGEPGAGKTWLARLFAGGLPAKWSSTRVDLTGSLGALDFLQLIGHSLGVPMSGGVGTARARLSAILHDDHVNGRRWLLVIDEAHRGSPAVWDEIQALVNQLGRPGGFAAMLVLGETELVRAMATRELGGFAASLSAHLHLMPLDLDEARELLSLPSCGDEEAERVLDELHRDVRGNPKALLRLAHRRPELLRPTAALDTYREPLAQARTSLCSPALHSTSAPELEEPVAVENEPLLAASQAAASSAERGRTESPSLIPTKPPIRDEEGLVEVGWDGDLETEGAQPDYAQTRPETLLLDDSSFNEELIEDRYATLQARTEWSESQELTAFGSVATQAPIPRSSPEEPLRSDTASSEAPPGSLEPVPATAPPGVRAEPQHEFAPYSQLFTRLRQSKQP